MHQCDPIVRELRAVNETVSILNKCQTCIETIIHNISAAKNKYQQKAKIKVEQKPVNSESIRS